MTPFNDTIYVGAYSNEGLFKSIKIIISYIPRVSLFAP